MATVELEGRELHYEVEGKGPTVVLIHSAIADHSLWDPQVEALRDRFRVVRYDVAGFGRSPLPSGPIAHVDDLQALLGHVGVERAAVVGNSMAARIALEYALAHPEVVDRLVLIAGGLTDHEWSELQREADAEEERLFEAGEFEGAADGQVRFWVDGPGRGPDAVDSELREWSRSRILRSYELYREAARNGDVGPWKWPEPPAVERLGDVGVPTLIVVGEHDVVDLLQIADRLEAAIPGARKEIVADAAHLLPLEQPEAVNRLLLDFLGER